MIGHLLIDVGKNRFDTSVTRNTKNINGIPVNDDDWIKFVNNAVTTTPIFDFLKILINTDATKIRTIVLPVPSSEWPKSSHKS